jgi:hypothetical protein
MYSDLYYWIFAITLVAAIVALWYWRLGKQSVLETWAASTYPLGEYDPNRYPSEIVRNV